MWRLNLLEPTAAETLVPDLLEGAVSRKHYSFEILTFPENTAVDGLDTLWNRDLLDSTLFKAALSDRLQFAPFCERHVSEFTTLPEG